MRFKEVSQEIEIYADGAITFNPNGIMSIGYIIIDGAKTLYEHSEKLKTGTNNVAEYLALISALEKALELGLENRLIDVYTDSELIVHIINRLSRIMFSYLNIGGKDNRRGNSVHER